MSWKYYAREISVDDYNAIKSGRKRMNEFFSKAELVGYGAIPSGVYEANGRYWIDYGISDSCD